MRKALSASCECLAAGVECFGRRPRLHGLLMRVDCARKKVGLDRRGRNGQLVLDADVRV
jgi:hypothetical protein